MKIYVCIPSFNEAQTISRITELVDQGFKSLETAHGEDLNGKIVNVDSASTDGTSDVFQGTNTYFPKQSIVLPEPRGKGKNLLTFIQLARREGATHCLTIDADIQSAVPAWLECLLGPILSGSADFVTPSYARSRFEGSTTNHFAYPVVLAATGRHVRQPIAGDFAFTSALFDALEGINIPDAAQQYGIDICLTLAALTHGLRHRQVELGKKVHNPSFDKLEYMFPQIAAAGLHLLRQTGIEKSPLPVDSGESANIIPTSTFAHRNSAELMRARAFSRINSPDINSCAWIPSEIKSKFVGSNEANLSLNDWVDILAAWLVFGLENPEINAELLGNQLLPFFVLRAVSFWFSSEQMNAEEVEQEIKRQAQLLHARFQ